MPILNRDRIKIYSRTILATYIITIAVLLIFRSDLLDPMGKPIGTDFLAHYAGSRLALQGEAAAAYEYSRLREVEAEVLGRAPPPLYWLYPPSYFLFILPLALLPYIGAWVGWMLVTGAGYVAVAKHTFADRLTLPLTLAFPATIQNFVQGQNGFLSAFFFGGGLLIISKRPLVGGIVLGAMSYKPHLAVLLPIALIACRLWMAFAGFLLGVLGLVTVSTIFFGSDTWLVYFQNIMFAGQVLQTGGAPLFKAPTTFALVSLLGADLTTARIAQSVVSVASLVVVVWLWSRRAASFSLKAAGLVIGSLLFTPSCYDYDLVLVAIAIAWLALHMRGNGHNSYEDWALVIAWASPLALPIIAAATNVQLGPMVFVLLFCIIVQRALRELRPRTMTLA